MTDQHIFPNLVNPSVAPSKSLLTKMVRCFSHPLFQDENDELLTFVWVSSLFFPVWPPFFGQASGFSCKPFG